MPKNKLFSSLLEENQQKSTKKKYKTLQLYLLLLAIFELNIYETIYYNRSYYSESILKAITLGNSAKMKTFIFAFLSVSD